MKEEIWNKNDVGSIINYIDEKKEKGTLAILNIYEEIIDEIRGIEYPISLSSRIFRLGLKKDRELEQEILLKYVGDWCYQGKVSEVQREQLDKISKTRTLEDDL